ncbi:MAG: bifunctional adenosylcobinamide kinase/adenosylcobinamide-phosphate guanylyltransferase [Eubacterium sp.]|nr:bifunctional adenosylcobinamide kinase/adenosylcobinamide-phosphate guanylyltransferase [Eubacterium sp.]
MILITGGAWQGKREYAYGLMDTDSDKKLIIQGDRCSAEDMKRVQIVDQLHLWIRRKMEELLPTPGVQRDAAGIAVDSDGGWDERVFDQQEMLLTQEKIWQELMEVVSENPDVIFIVNELGCGVIPMDVHDRRYRELVGRTCCDLAKEAKEVHRVVCGVGEVLKKRAASVPGENVAAGSEPEKPVDDTQQAEIDGGQQTEPDSLGDNEKQLQAESGVASEEK